METFKERSVLMRGLTWRSLLALVYIVFVFQPGIAYLHLMTGSVPMAAAIQWATILLFIEICALTGKPLSMSEAIIIYLGSAETLKYWWFLAPTMGNLTHPGWIYQAYFKHSPIATALGIADKVPWYYAPLSTDPWIMRTFFHPDWAPITLYTIIFFITAMFGDIALNLFAYQLYVKVEKLPFPTALPVVEASETLIQRDWKRLSFLAAASAFASVYGLVLYILPLLGRVLWGASILAIPVPWTDHNLLIHRAAPGSSFGIATDLAVFATGFIIPFKVSLGMVIGAVALYFFGNYILVNYGITDFTKEYTYGMTIRSAWERSFLHAWAMPMVGVALAVGIMPLILHPDLLARTFRALRRFKESPVGVSIWWFIIPFVASTLALSAYGFWLAPDASLPLLIFLNVIWPFISLIIIARGEGLGAAFGVPYMRELTLRATGYPGINAWFVPVYTSSSAATAFKICDLTDTKPLDFILASYIIFPIALVFGFFFMQSFWSLAPVPSAIYPGVLYTWPVQATFQAIFISPEAGKFFVAPRILYGFIVGAVLYLVGDRLGFASTVIGIASGMASPIPVPISTFIGAIMGKLIARRMGDEWWNKYRGIAFAGILLGNGLIVAVGTAIAIIVKSMWAWPY